MSSAATPPPDRSPQTLDPRTPDGARFLLLQEDVVLRAQFVAALEREVDALAAALARCFSQFQRLQEGVAVVGSDRAQLIRAFAHGALDDLIVSTKLLLTGKVAASGNVARQAVEGIAMALLCTTDDDLVIQARPQKGDLLGKYWVRVQDVNDRLVEGQRAVQQLEWNADRLRLPGQWIGQLAAVQKRFSAASHAGLLAVSFRSSFQIPQTVSFGGHFDLEKLTLYRADLLLRAHVAVDLGKVMEHLLTSMGPSP